MPLYFPQAASPNAANRDGSNLTNISAWLAALGISSDVAFANLPGVAFHGVASDSARIVSAMTGQAIGTGAFSVWARFLCPATPSEAKIVVNMASSPTATVQARAFHVYVGTSGELLIRLRGATSSDTRDASVSGFVSAWEGQVVDVVVTRDGSTLSVYVNGTAQTVTESTAGTPPAWSDTVTADYTVVGFRDVNGAAWASTIYRVAVFNRALSASDCAALVTRGIDPADQFGSQSAKYTSDFSAGSDSFGVVRGTVTGNQDGISGVDDTLLFAPDGTTSATHYFNRTLTSQMTFGKRYKLVFDYYIPVGNTYVDGMSIQQNNGSGWVGSVLSTPGTTGSWQTDVESFAFVCIAKRLDFRLTEGGSTSTANDWSTDNVYVKNVRVIQLGAIVDLDLGVGVGYQAHDRSGNRRHGTIYGALRWTQPRREGVLYAETSTNGNEQLLGATVSIPTNAVIRSVSVNNVGGGGVATSAVALGSSSGAVDIVANGGVATSISSGVTMFDQTTPDARPGWLSSTGNLWAGADGTDALRWTIQYHLTD